MALLKLKKVESLLSGLEQFDSPQVELEQYSTPAHLAACFLHTIHSDLYGMSVCDIGAGCGTLSVGASLLGAGYVLGVDIDPGALETLQANAAQLGLANLDTLVSDVESLSDTLRDKFDTVVMNPPFGTRNPGIDVKFVEAGLRLAPVVYSLHKTTTRSYLTSRPEKLGATSATVLAQLRYNLDNSYKFHKRKSVDIHVDLIEFKR